MEHYIITSARKGEDRVSNTRRATTLRGARRVRTQMMGPGLDVQVWAVQGDHLVGLDLSVDPPVSTGDMRDL